jgi:hypothetical protein
VLQPAQVLRPGAGCACANPVEPDTPLKAAGISPASIGDGIAKTFAVPASIKQPRSQVANGSRCVVTTGSWAGRELAAQSIKDPGG